MSDELEKSLGVYVYADISIKFICKQQSENKEQI